jgi:hypothetical protein
LGGAVITIKLDRKEIEMNETKICKKCGRILPIENFTLKRGQVFQNPYYSGHCKECENKYYREYEAKKRKVDYTFSDSLELVTERKYKTINKERILDISNIGMEVALMGTDEIFVRLMEYKDAWISNYGRLITKTYNNRYTLLKGSYINGELRYSVKKNVFVGGKWVYKHDYIYAHKMVVVETFIVNEDKANNIYIWNSGHDKGDCYYRNLYPLNQEQFRVVNNHFNETGDDSEWFILNVMNDTRFKPDGWNKKKMKPVMFGRGYHGILYVNSKEEAYNKWHYIMNRCYSPAVHELYSEYEECEICEEWYNFSNFKLWYDENILPWKSLGIEVDIDKDILFKGNKVYSPDTVSLVPSIINKLFISGDSSKSDLPLGVWWEKDKNKYRAGMNFLGDKIKLGTFDTVEEAFARYKEYKEDFIKDMAEQYKGKITDRTYQAMITWVVEITD